MCSSGDHRPANASEALALVEAGLDYLNGASVASMGSAAQADLLKGLERADAKHTAARVHVLAAFHAGRGFEDDGQYSARTWLIWQTGVTRGAAAGAVGWMKRVRSHPSIWQALADGSVSASWARDICSWTDKLPEADTGDADRILLAAAAGGAALPDLAALAWEMYQRSRAGQPDADPDDGFDDRSLHLGQTFARTGRLEGDLTASATAALRTVLDSLAGQAGPEDTRTKAQREHDALEEACVRLIGSGMLPERAGQPVHLQLQVNLDQLLGTGTSVAEQSWPSGLTGPEVRALACDAIIEPFVTGRVNQDALDTLVEMYFSAHPARGTSSPASSRHVPPGLMSRDCLRQTILRLVTDVLSGPGGLASALRSGQPFPVVSLPLDVGEAKNVIPGHLRRAVILRDKHCRFPGCWQPPVACQVHHVIHREDDGSTSVENCCLMCRFHHLIVIHRWGWKLIMHPDGTTTATSPAGRVLHSHRPPGHGPPAKAA